MNYSEILEAVNENLLRKYRLTLPEVNGKHPSEVINMIYENALKSKFTGLNYITENNIKRKEFSAYSDWYHGGAIGDRDFFNKLFISNMTKQKA